MGRKFINRDGKKGLDSKKDVEAEDEWAHLTDVNGEETKIEAKDALDVQDRSITFGDELNEVPKTPFEIVKEETRNAMDAAGNTGQYIRFVNAHIDGQKKEIDKIKKIKEKFDREIQLLF